MDGNDLKTYNIVIEHAIKDTSGNTLLGYGSPIQIGDPSIARNVTIHGHAGSFLEVNAEVLINSTLDVSGGEIIINGESVAPWSYINEYNIIQDTSIFLTKDYVFSTLDKFDAEHIGDASLSNDFSWNTSGLLKVDVSVAGTGVSPDLDYGTYEPLVGDTSFIYSGDLITQIVTVNFMGTKIVDFIYDANEDVSVININNYGESTKAVTFEKDIDENIIAVHIA